MSQPAINKVQWTSADLFLLPENGNRYEIIAGDLFVTRAPRWSHQKIVAAICHALNSWSRISGLGEAVMTPGLIFSDLDHVIPDVVWISYPRLNALLDESEHLTGAPELIVEVLSPGTENQRRDREIKRKLYAIQGVLEYWITDPPLQQIQIYRRQDADLVLTTTLMADDELRSPLLPGFSCQIRDLF